MSVDPLTYSNQSFLNGIIPNCHQSNFWVHLANPDLAFANMSSPQFIPEPDTEALLIYDGKQNSSVAQCMAISPDTMEGTYLLPQSHLPSEYQLFHVPGVGNPMSLYGPTSSMTTTGASSPCVTNMPKMLNQVPTQRQQHYHHRHHAHAKHNQGNKTRFSATGLSPYYTVVRDTKMSLSSAPSSPNAGSVIGSLGNYTVAHVPVSFSNSNAYSVPQCKGSSSSSGYSSKTSKMSTSSSLSSYSSCSSLSSSQSATGISPRKRPAEEYGNNNCRKDCYQRQSGHEVINLCSCEMCATDEVTAGVDDVTLRDATVEEFGQQQKRSKNDDDVVFVSTSLDSSGLPTANGDTSCHDVALPKRLQETYAAPKRLVRKARKPPKKKSSNRVPVQTSTHAQADSFPFVVPTSTPYHQRQDPVGRYYLRSAAKGRKQDEIALREGVSTSVYHQNPTPSTATPIVSHGAAVRAIDLNNNGDGYACTVSPRQQAPDVCATTAVAPRYHTRSQKKLKAVPPTQPPSIHHRDAASAYPSEAAVASRQSTATLPGTPTVASQPASVIQSSSANNNCKQHASVAFESSPTSSGKDPHRPSSSFKKLYDIHGIIGVGGGGTVYAGTRKADGVQVAIKQVPKAKVKRWGKLDDRVVPIEFELLYRASKTSHRGIITMLDWYERRTTYILVMERPQPVIDLFDYLNQYGALPEPAARSVFRQIAEAVIHCHANGVVHRDIKDENVILNLHTSEAKLIDFGCGTVLKEAPYTEFAGTPEFYPPEWFTHRRYEGRRVDAWSLGVLLFTMVEAEVPFQKEKDIVECNLRHKHAGRLSESCRNLIAWMLQKDPNARPTIEQALAHPWFQQSDIPPPPAHSGVMGTDEIYEKRLHFHQNGSHLTSSKPVVGGGHHKVASADSPESPPRYNQGDLSVYKQQHCQPTNSHPPPSRAGVVFHAVA